MMALRSKSKIEPLKASKSTKSAKLSTKIVSKIQKDASFVREKTKTEMESTFVTDNETLNKTGNLMG
jgi:hypothetical protein